MTPLYSPKQAAARLGISVTTVRAHTDRYARHLSTEATGNPRRLTPADLRALAYVITRAGQGRTHEQILAAWEEDFPGFEWEGDEDDPDGAGPETTALVPAAQLQAARALMLDAQRREQEAAERERALQGRVEDLLRALGKTEGELAAIRAQMEASPQARSWWARLMGRG